MVKIISKQTGQGVLSVLQTFVSICLVFAWTGASLSLYLIGMPSLIVFVFLVLSGGALIVVFFVYILDKEKFDRIVSYCKLVNRKRKGDAKIHLFKLPIKELQKHVPIKTVHDKGIIEYFDTEHKMFKKRVFGVLFTYDPPPVPGSHDESFDSAIERIVHSFGPDLEITIHFYDMIDNTNPLAENVLESMNDPNNTLPQKQHLHGIYEEATRNTEPRTSTRYLMSIKLGEFKTIDHARQSYRSIVPGILKSLREQNIYTMQVVGENAVAMELRKFATMEDF